MQVTYNAIFRDDETGQDLARSVPHSLRSKCGLSSSLPVFLSSSPCKYGLCSGTVALITSGCG